MLRSILLWCLSVSFVGIFVMRIIRGDFDTYVFVFVILTVVFLVLKDLAFQHELKKIRKEMSSRRLHGL